MACESQPARLLCPWNSPGQNAGVGSHSLFQGIFPTQGSNPGLLHCRQILYHLNHQGSPRILEWVAYPFSRGTSWPRNRTSISCIAGRFFTRWATWEDHQTDHRKKAIFKIVKGHPKIRLKTMEKQTNPWQLWMLKKDENFHSCFLLSKAELTWNVEMMSLFSSIVYI